MNLYRVAVNLEYMVESSSQEEAWSQVHAYMATLDYAKGTDTVHFEDFLVEEPHFEFDPANGNWEGEEDV